MTQPAPVSESTKKRVKEGISLYEKGGVKEHEPGIYLVPSRSEEGRYRSVRINADACSCPDFQHQKAGEDREPCAHIYAAAFFHAKHGRRSA